MIAMTSVLLTDIGDSRLLLLASSVVSALPHNISPTCLIFCKIPYIILNRYEPSKVWFIILLLLAIPGFMVAPLRSHFTTLANTIAAAFIVHWSLPLLMTIGYRLSPLHPLSQLPGPVLCKMSKGWLAYLTAKNQKAHLYVKKLHEMYGDVVRIGKYWQYSKDSRLQLV